MDLWIHLCRFITQMEDMGKKQEKQEAWEWNASQICFPRPLSLLGAMHQLPS
jgi:hypothetical protein